ncbi:hypothetical protein [Lysobacter solisilvae (ex Woo and Kim 2020)]|uniref:YihY/virulence factor BrkB family protein n=1 Tax=Agrilutibacter terrestris TaxID=2865112 RepID=A0A7H0FTS0_9GAMM|nr:hypothetical protein [Lysobacter terrestris]QNP39436.1 hypothetical protein H8B22_07730 [Lysobacter terrestris]
MTTRANGPLAGLAWLKRAFSAGRHNPRAIFGGASLLMVAALVPGFLQAFAHALLQPGPGVAAVLAALTTLLAVVLLGPLMGGYLRVIDASEHGRPAHASDVLAPFRDARDARRMILFSLVMLLVQLGALSLLWAVFGGALQNLQEWYLRVVELLQAAKPGQPAQLPAPPAGLGGLFSLAGLCALFVGGVFAVGLGQLALRGQGVAASVFAGLSGAARNLLPLLVLAAVALALMMAAGVVLALVAGILGLLHPVLALVAFLPLYMLFVLSLYVVMFGVVYHLWRDVAGDAPTAAGGIEA